MTGKQTPLQGGIATWELGSFLRENSDLFAVQQLLIKGLFKPETELMSIKASMPFLLFVEFTSCGPPSSPEMPNACFCRSSMVKGLTNVVGFQVLTQLAGQIADQLCCLQHGVMTSVTAFEGLGAANLAEVTAFFLLQCRLMGPLNGPTKASCNKTSQAISGCRRAWEAFWAMCMHRWPLV